jgi:hypothetical protein
MVFPRCAKCGLVGGIACACAFATVHHQSLCGEFDRGGVYCSKFTAELPHGPHHDRPITWVSSVPTTSAELWAKVGDGMRG